MAGRFLNCQLTHVILRVKKVNMADRSYAQIRWQQDRFGLLLVNSRRERFFLYADKLQELCDRDDNYVILKLRDRKPSRAIGYYPGQVVGTIDRKNASVVISLYISEPYSDVKFKETAEFMEPNIYHVAQVFTFPYDEFEIFKNALDTMLEQERLFSNELRSAEMTPLTTVQKSLL